MYERILVAVDGSELSNRALREAIALAKLSQGKLLLVYVVDILMPFVGTEHMAIDPTPLIEANRETGLAMLRESECLVAAEHVPVETYLAEIKGGTIPDRIVREARAFGAQIIVAGSHGRSGFSRLLMGSVSDGLLRNSPVPVLVVRTASEEAQSIAPVPETTPYAGPPRGIDRNG